VRFRKPKTVVLRELREDEAGWIASQLISWFSENGRNFSWRSPHSTPYEILIAEVFLQQTPAQRVAQYLPTFLKRFPDFDSLRTISPGQITDVLTPLGLQRRRTNVLISLAEKLVGVDLRDISEGDWRKLPGVGQYVAAAMLSTLYDKPEPMLDINAARVFGRYAGPRLVADIRRDWWLYRTVRRVLAHGSPRVLNWGIMDLGALICTSRKPSCSACPLNAGCTVGAPAVVRRRDVGGRRPRKPASRAQGTPQSFSSQRGGTL